MHGTDPWNQWRATADEEGTTSSPWRYDAAADQALQSANLRELAILRSASSVAAFPISQGDPGTLR